MENFDDLTDIREKLEGKVDSFICTLGTQQKHGKETFTKVDFQYPVNFAKFGKEIGVKHFGLLTSACLSWCESNFVELLPENKGSS